MTFCKYAEIDLVFLHLQGVPGILVSQTGFNNNNGFSSTSSHRNTCFQIVHSNFVIKLKVKVGWLPNKKQKFALIQQKKHA